MAQRDAIVHGVGDSPLWPGSGGGEDVTPSTVLHGPLTDVSPSAFTVWAATNETTTLEVEYGTTASYGSTATSLRANTAPVAIVKDLAASTTYHYRYRTVDVAANASEWSSDQTISTTTTPSATPWLSRAEMAHIVGPRVDLSGVARSAGIDTTADGQVISGHKGTTINVKHANVVIEDFDLDANPNGVPNQDAPPYCISITNSAAAAGLTVRYGKATGWRSSFMPPYSTDHHFHHLDLEWGMGSDALKVGQSNWLLEYIFIHDKTFEGVSGQHADLLQCREGLNWTFRNSHLIGPYQKSNACLFIGVGGGANTGWTVHDCFISGGNYCFWTNNAATGTSYNMTFDGYDYEGVNSTPAGDPRNSWQYAAYNGTGGVSDQSGWVYLDGSPVT